MIYIGSHSTIGHNHIAEMFFEEDCLYGASAIPAKSFRQNIGKNTVKKFRISRVTARFVKKRERDSQHLDFYNPSKSECFWRVSNPEVVHILPKQTVNFIE